jgi:signal transduction histidine kinase
MKTAIFHSLYFKLASGLALILLVVGLSYTLFASYMVQQINQSSYQIINRGLAQKLVKDNKIVQHGQIDEKHLKDTFMQYMMINPGIEIYYLDLQGKILAYSAEPGKVKRETVTLAPILKLLKNNQASGIVGDDPRTPGLQKPFSVTAIPGADNPQGYLYVMLQSEELTSALNRQSQQTIVYLGGIVIAGSLLLGLLLGLFVFYRINQRLKNLQLKVAQFVRNDFSTQGKELFSSKELLLQDEISELERYIMDMTEHIQQQWSALKQQDSLRREMVANISHDLRTPLASLQGYLETLSIKFDDLPEAQKKEYINTSVKQAKGLQKLIDSLFELAKLDAREHHLRLEKFPIMELLYDVLAKFELKARQKNIELKIESAVENPRVFADLGLIERVLDNLINNAIYYSHPNGKISIQVAAPENGTLTVKVVDNGQGIAEDQKALVFERFHQAHSPQREDGHAGLGLCIVKKIIELHQQKVWVESQLDKGSEFNFTLAAV